MPVLGIPFNYIVILLNGIDMNDKNIYHYAAINEDRIEAFTNAVRSGQPYDLKDYGIVLQSGTGQPSDEVKEKMEKQYGCNHKSIVTIG